MRHGMNVVKLPVSSVNWVLSIHIRCVVVPTNFVVIKVSHHCHTIWIMSTYPFVQLVVSNVVPYVVVVELHRWHPSSRYYAIPEQTKPWNGNKECVHFRQVCCAPIMLCTTSKR